MHQYKWGPYTFDVHRMDSPWAGVGGLYVFAMPIPALQLGAKLGSFLPRRDPMPLLPRLGEIAPPAMWGACYIGTTESFADRFADHERWGEATALGATTVHVRVETNAVIRAQLEQDLIRMFQPPLNDHYRTAARLLTSCAR